MYANDHRTDAKIVDVALKEVDSGQDPQLMINFELADPGPCPSRITAFLSFSEKAIQYTEEKLRNCGWDPIVNSWGIDDLCEMKPIVDRTVSLVIGEDEYQGKRRWKVKFINAPGGGMAKRASSDTARDFTRQLRTKLGVQAPASAGMRRPVAARPAAAAARQAPAEQAADAEGIPF